MKDLVKIEQGLGDGAAQVKAAFGVEGQNLKVEASITYPIAKVVEPATKAVDGLLDKLKKAIPGDWDDALIEKFKEEYKEELVKLLAE